MSDKARAKRIMDGYGLTLREWAIIELYQNGVCFLCGKTQKSGKRLATDHDHSSGLVRGLLCSQCNRILGRIEGSKWTIATLNRLIEYLTSPPATSALGRQVFGFAGRVGTKRHRLYVKRAKKSVPLPNTL